VKVVTASELAAVLDDRGLVERLREAFREGADAPLRHRHAVPAPGGEGTLLLMPAWQRGRSLGVKVVTVFPGNASRGLSAVQAAYLLLDAETGAPLALMDGTMLTRRRTAAASALAADYLARRDSATLVMVGTGSLAPHLIGAHAAIRPIREVRVWGRSPDKARALAASVMMAAGSGRADVRVTPVEDLEAAVRAADVVSCATLASDPLIRGAWLRPGTHLDLVGGFTPAMREADDDAVRRSRVFVDTPAALEEAGDVVQPIASGVLKKEDVADLFDLARGRRPGRTDEAQVTLFKSVGAALEDLAAARLAFERLSR
jgi:ornithine cyclodeaminase/alanine dehydrogenase-like protein (mu-crystallin family)